MKKGYLSFLLHAHLPFVRHPEHDNFLEENWLYEAITETYIPLVAMIDKLLDEEIDFSLTVSLSPTLISMLGDELLCQRYINHLNRLIELSEKEIVRTSNDYGLNRLAYMYRDIFKHTQYIYVDKYKMDILSAFRKFDRSNKVEVITCCATHGYLPLMEIYEPAVKAQVKTAVDTYKNVFGHLPKGLWLPECGYHPGHDEILKEFGIQYFVTDTHGVVFASPRPSFGVHNPYLCPSGMYVFGRDSETSKAVWSANEGYPGHPDYREFYRDIGYDLEHGYLAQYLNGDSSRRHTGIKYWRITGETDNKHLYVPEWAKSTVVSHADNFIFNREHQVEYLFKSLSRKPIILAPYDAELYGHWWFEGIEWLDCVIRKVASSDRNFGLITPSQYLNIYRKYQPIRPSMSSWGYKGYSEVWINGANDWIYRHIHKITEYMIALADRFQSAEGVLRLALNQLARELLLAQSSDWTFMMKNNVFVEYAQKRVINHIEEFLKIYHMIEHNDIDEEWLTKRYSHYNIFPDIDYSMYRTTNKHSSVYV